MPENIDAVHELIMPDGHVTYRKSYLWAFLPLIYIRYCMNTVKKICSRWIPQSLKKRLFTDWCIEMWNVCFKRRLLDRHRWNKKLGPSKTSQIQQKLFVEKAPRSKWSPVSWATLKGQFWLAHHNFFGETRKTNKQRRIIDVEAFKTMFWRCLNRSGQSAGTSVIVIIRPEIYRASLAKFKKNFFKKNLNKFAHKIIL